MSTRTTSLRTALAVAVAVLLGPAIQAETPAPVLALKGLDPVALTEGREVAGREELTQDHRLYRYRFAAADSQRRFSAEPERFAIQQSGACGRMGPLSGQGSPERFLVHEGRIYLFASEACRTSFAKAPERFLEGDDAPPSGGPEERRRGAELVERAAKAMGAAELARLKTVTFDMSVTFGEGAKAQTGHRQVTIGVPDQYRFEESWGEWTGGDILSGETAKRVSGNEVWVGDMSIYRALVRSLYRQPLALLLARTRPGFVAVALDPSESAGQAGAGGRKTERVAVAYRGATSTLAIDAETGRVVSVAFRGWGDSGLGAVEIAFSDFRPVAGISLPWGISTAFDGQPVAEPKLVVENIEVEGTR